MKHEQNSSSLSVSFAVEVKDKRAFCAVFSSHGEGVEPVIRCEGESEEHAIAIALEQLASHYRQAAESKQNADLLTVETTKNGKTLLKPYHVILHYERIAQEVSRFEAVHNTIMGNTVVENAQISVIEIDETITIEPIVRPWD